MKKPEAAKVRVISLQPPGPKWQPVGEPTTRAAAAILIGKEWAKGRLARIVSIVKAQAKAKAS